MNISTLLHKKIWYSTFYFNFYKVCCHNENMLLKGQRVFSTKNMQKMSGNHCLRKILLPSSSSLPLFKRTGWNILKSIRTTHDKQWDLLVFAVMSQVSREKKIIKNIIIPHSAVLQSSIYLLGIEFKSNPGRDLK